MGQRTNATNFFDKLESLKELDRLKFAVAALVQIHTLGSCEYENAANATRGIKNRLDYLHDSLEHIFDLEEEVKP